MENQGRREEENNNYFMARPLAIYPNFPIIFEKQQKNLCRILDSKKAKGGQRTKRLLKTRLRSSHLYIIYAARG